MEAAAVEAQASVRVCVIVANEALESWEISTVRQLCTADGVELVAYILTSDESAAGHRRHPASGDRRSGASGTGRGAASRKIEYDLRSVFPPAISRWDVAGSDVSPEVADLEIARRVRNSEIDVVLDLRTTCKSTVIAAAARFGLWHFDHEGEAAVRIGSAQWWAAYGAAPVIGARLLRVGTAEGETTVLREGFVAVLRYAFASSVGALLRESARWPAQACADIRNGALPTRAAGARSLARITAERPHAGQRLLFRARIVGHFLRAAWVRLFRHDHWRIGIIEAPIESVMRNPGTARVRWLDWRPRGEFIADPFGILRDGRLTIMCEGLDYRTNRGTIDSIDDPAESGPAPTRVAIGPDVHRSYPYLVEHDGVLYCIPETHRANEVAIYRAIDFPERWEKVTTLIAGAPLLDSTVFRHDGRWWLACTDQSNGQSLNLHLWYASELLGPWRPHAVNPVKTDPRSSRPGGTPFLVDGVLHRPSQDCSRTYGGRIVINRVTVLTPVAFHEEVAAVLEPGVFGRELAGLHTMSSAGAWTLIDAKRTQFAPSAFRRVLRDSVGLLRRGLASAGDS